MLEVGEVDYSPVLQSNVICVEDDFSTDRYGCGCCCFDNKHHDCIADLFTDDKFECRYNRRSDKKDVHFEKYEQTK